MTFVGAIVAAIANVSYSVLGTVLYELATQTQPIGYANHVVEHR